MMLMKLLRCVFLPSGPEPLKVRWRNRPNISAAGAVAGATLVFVLTSLPLYAAEEAAPDPAEMPVGTIFRWLNFVLVFGGIAYLVVKFGAPYFRANARVIAGGIHEAADARAAAERELHKADERLGAVNLEIQDMRRAAVRETNTEAERLRTLARTEAEKIKKAASAEIEASERAGRQELRAIAARLATARAAEMIRAQMNPAAEAALFHAFVAELERSAQ
jgi:F-type H+-transporting ATPase subunit b